MLNNNFRRCYQAKQRQQMPLFYIEDVGLKAATDTAMSQQEKLIEKLTKRMEKPPWSC